MDAARPALWSGKTLAFLTLRLWLGVRALATGIEKYAGVEVARKPLVDDLGMPDINGTMIEVKQKVYGLAHYQPVPESMKEAFAAQPLLPGFLLGPFYACLGPALVLLGVALLLGVATRPALALTGLLYTALTFGLILLNEPGGIAWLGVHVGLTAAALALADHNRLALGARLRPAAR